MTKPDDSIEPRRWQVIKLADDDYAAHGVLIQGPRCEDEALVPETDVVAAVCRASGLLTMFKGFVTRIEDNSRGSFSDEAARRFLAAINEECAKTLAGLDRMDLLDPILTGKIAPMSDASNETGPTVTSNDVIVDGEQRYYPVWGSTVVKQEDLDDQVFISDIFGGHALWITREEWDALETEAPHDH